MTILQQNRPNDGGPAFPNGDLGAEVQPGMSLRDYFAAHALVVIGVAGRIGDAPVGASIASMVYQLADAMLAQRAKGGQQ